jgi:hypothetical protein
MERKNTYRTVSEMKNPARNHSSAEVNGIFVFYS